MSISKKSRDTLSAIQTAPAQTWLEFIKRPLPGLVIFHVSGPGERHPGEEALFAREQAEAAAKAERDKRR